MTEINPTDALVISKKWLEEQIRNCKTTLESTEDEELKFALQARVNAYEYVLSHSTSLTPLIEDAFDKGYSYGYETADELCEQIALPKKQYLNQLTIKLP